MRGRRGLRIDDAGSRQLVDIESPTASLCCWLGGRVGNCWQPAWRLANQITERRLPAAAQDAILPHNGRARFRFFWTCGWLRTSRDCCRDGEAGKPRSFRFRGERYSRILFSRSSGGSRKRGGPERILAACFWPRHNRRRRRRLMKKSRLLPQISSLLAYRGGTFGAAVESLFN